MKTRGFEKISFEQWQADTKQVLAYINNNGFLDKKERVISEELYANVRLPKRGTKHSAGYDIYAPFEIILKPGDSIKVPTGLKAYMQGDEYLAIYPRSSMGFKYFMRLANTVAVGDSDYYNNENNEGHYWILIRNEGSKTMTIDQGQAFAQAIFQKYLLADNDDTVEERTGGVGSTDNK